MNFIDNIKSYAKSKGYIPIDISSQLGDIPKYIKFNQKLNDPKYDKCLFIIDTEVLDKDLYEIYKDNLIGCNKHAFIFSNKKNTKVFIKNDSLENKRLSIIDDLMCGDRNCIVCFEEYRTMKSCRNCSKLICINCLIKLYDNNLYNCPNCRS